jgi:hypothetical protein
MLVTKTTTNTSSTAKQIVVKATTSTTLYTVPTGKTFTGQVFAHMGNGIECNINGVVFISLTPTTPYFGTPVPLTLLAGTVVSCGPSYANWTLFGIEQ